MARAMNEHLIKALGDLIENRTAKWLKRGGCSISWDWIVDLFDGDEALTRAVLLRGGYSPSKYCVGVWRYKSGAHCLQTYIDDAPFREQVGKLLAFYQN